MAYKRTLRAYYQLSKPGIIYANLLTAIAGYLLASRFHVHVLAFSGLCLGLVLTIASACSFNNYLDQGLDVRMQRTRGRSLVTGELSSRQALSYATASGAFGIFIAALTQNVLTTSLLIIALFDYVVLYGIGKRATVHGTLIGCISGAIPLVAGYTAFTGRLSGTAWLLFVLMVAWQMAHFYGIALYRLQDYTAAKLPVMPAVYGARVTQLQTLAYMALFIIVSCLLIVRHDIGFIAGSVLVLIGATWLLRATSSFQRLAAEAWGRQTFLFSLIVILTMSLSLSVGPLLA